MNNTPQFVYLVHTPEKGKHVFSLGTTSIPQERLASYPKGSKYIVIFCCPDHTYLNNILVAKFGRGYFEGDTVSIVDNFMTTCVDICTVCEKYPITTVPYVPRVMKEEELNYKRLLKNNCKIVHHMPTKIVRSMIQRPQNPIWRRTPSRV